MPASTACQDDSLLRFLTSALGSRRYGGNYRSRRPSMMIADAGFPFAFIGVNGTRRGARKACRPAGSTRPSRTRSSQRRARAFPRVRAARFAGAGDPRAINRWMTSSRISDFPPIFTKVSPPFLARLYSSIVWVPTASSPPGRGRRATKPWDAAQRPLRPQRLLRASLGTLAWQDASGSVIHIARLLRARRPWAPANEAVRCSLKDFHRL